MMPRNPLQPLVVTDDGVIRFKGNAIVRALLDFASEKGMSLNEIACMNFTQDDQEQFAQLIGYSLLGFHELSYVSDETALTASVEARKIVPNANGCRDHKCEIHYGVERE